MHIQDFHSKLTSSNDEGHLFAALRNLSRIENPSAMLKGESDIVPMGEWPAWPPIGAHTSYAASEEV
jgi:hypothetical protein